MILSFLPDLSVNALFYIAILMIVGLIFGKLAKFVKLPNVTGYIVGGLALTYFIKLMLFLTHQDVKEISTIWNSLNIIADIELGFIAFSIGAEFKIKYFKEVGIKPFIIALCESYFAVLFVLFILVIFFRNQVGMPFILLLSAIAAATAPGATLLVIRQYRAKGDVTSMLLNVVALDDATALIAFGFLATIANQILNKGNGNIEISLGLSILIPFAEVAISVVLGFVVAFILIKLLKIFSNPGNRATSVIFAIFVTTAISYVIRDNTIFHPSELLAIMTMSAVFVNTYHNSDEILSIVDRFLAPVIVIFFVLAGAKLELEVLPTVGLIGLTYIIVRVMGKLFGAWFGAKVSKAPPKVRKYLGWGLLPQGGVEIGLAMVASNYLIKAGEVELGNQLLAVMLCGVLIYQLFGPVIAKIALSKTGELVDYNNKKLTNENK